MVKRSFQGQGAVAAPRDRPAGVTALAVFLVAASLLHMLTLVDVAHYAYVFQSLPHWLLAIRYGVSWAMRILSLMSAVGMLRLRESARKVALSLCWFTIVTIYWKHPYEGFRRHTEYLDAVLAATLASAGSGRPAWLDAFTFTSLTVPALVVACALDVVFAAGVICYLTRPGVREHFEQ